LNQSVPEFGAIKTSQEEINKQTIFKNDPG